MTYFVLESTDGDRWTPVARRETLSRAIDEANMRADSAPRRTRYRVIDDRERILFSTGGGRKNDA